MANLFLNCFEIDILRRWVKKQNRNHFVFFEQREKKRSKEPKEVAKMIITNLSLKFKQFLNKLIIFVISKFLLL